VVLGAALFFFLLFLAGTFLYHALQGGGLPANRRGFLPIGFIVAVVLVILFVRSIRSVARPVGNVMEAADRVASGDYSARVDERGPPEMRSLARSFNQMTQRLAESDRRRRELLADIAHELRTPLSVIRGNAEAILDGLYPADRDHLEPLLEETVVMARLLDDLRVLSTAEAGVLRLHREPVRPEDLVEDAVAAFRTQADAQRVRIEARVSPGLPELDVDRVRIGEVLANLLTNSLRHTATGGSVTISAERARTGPVAFEVADTGAGIDPEELPHLFDRFVKAADSGGVGLGLAIAKALVEAHGGTISARSELGHGTTVRFELPTGRDPE
jgi:two-component system, OmpR family, sensor histidine kinase BaeS